MKILIVVDIQNDFIDGVLGTPEAHAIVPNVVGKIEEYLYEGGRILFTQDTHFDDSYDKTEEGKNLPVKHCILNTKGWKIVEPIQKYTEVAMTFPKNSFGSIQLFDDLVYANKMYKDKFLNIESIELVGVCTDICVISNAILAKTACPNVPIYVDASCCAGVSPESHDNAIKAMESLQMHILNKRKEPWRK